MRIEKIVILLLFLFSTYFGLTGAKYVIIAPDNFVPAVQPLAAWKTKKGVKAQIVPLSITGNTSSQIRNYILNAYNTWDIRPEYILLVGTGLRLPVSGSSDDYYADIINTGNPQIELSIGRFPVTNPSQCSTIVTKTLNYERTPYLADSSWFRKGTTVIDEDGYTLSDSVYWENCRYVHACWQNSGYTHIDSFSHLRGNNATHVMNAINNGRAFLVYRGSSVAYWWGFRIYPESTNNGSKLPIIVSGTCATMSLTDTNYIGDKFLSVGTPLNSKGAVGFFATTVADDLPGLASLRGTVVKGFFRSVFQDNVSKLGDATKRAKYILDSIRPFNYSDIRYREWNLFGDPELSIWTDTPRPLTVIHDTMIQNGPQYYNLTVRQAQNPVSGALVCVMMDSIIYQYSYTDSTGLASFLIYPPYPGIMSVTITAQNCIPYEKNVIIQPGGNIHDVGVLSVVEPQGQIMTGTNITPKVLVKNWGGYTDTFSLFLKIGNIYNYTIPSIILGACDTATISFPNWYTSIGNYSIMAYTTLTNDQWHGNDTLNTTTSIITPNDVGVEAILNPDTIYPLNRATLPKAKVKNYGTLTQSNFPVICSILGSNGLLRYYSSQTVSLAVNRDTVINFAVWTSAIVETCVIKISTRLTGDENPANNSKIRTVSIVQQYIENFEESNGGYIAAPLINGWMWGTPTSGPCEAHSGTKCWATVQNGNYMNNANWKLTSPVFTSNTDNPVLKFWHWFDIEDFVDGGNLKISTDSSATWTLIKPVNGYPSVVGYSNPAIPNESCYSGVSNWTEAVFNLPVISGQQFFIRWHFGTNNNTTSSGWYIDDIYGIGMSGQTPMANDVGVDSIFSPLTIHPLNVLLQPAAMVRNHGFVGQSNFPVVCSIVNNNGQLRYYDIKIVSLAEGRDTTIYFASWLPSTTEICTVKMNTQLVGDEVSENNRKTRISEIRWLLFEQGFEEPYFPPTGWVTYNNDNGTQCWNRGTINPYTGSACAESQLESSTLRNDDWLVTPAITIPSSSAELRFWYRAHVAGSYETLQVRLSTTDNSINGFATLLDAYRFNNITYAEKTIPLNGYANQNVYLAFVNKGLFQRKIYLDDIIIKGFTTGIIENAQTGKSPITMLYAPKPNPVKNIATINFSLAEPQKVALKIYNASGSVVKTLLNGFKTTGIYRINWNGKDEHNRRVAEGIYFYTLETPNQKFTKKLILTR